MCLFTLPLIHPPTHTHSHMKNIDQGVLNCIGVNKSQEFFLDITTIWYEQPTISIYKARKKVKYSAKRQWKWCYESFNGNKKGKKILFFPLIIIIKRIMKRKSFITYTSSKVDCRFICDQTKFAFHHHQRQRQ